MAVGGVEIVVGRVQMAVYGLQMRVGVGVLANDISERFRQSPSNALLSNHDLTRVSGRAIEAILRQLAEDTRDTALPERHVNDARALHLLADEVFEWWTGLDARPVQEADLPTIITDVSAERPEMLSASEWEAVVEDLVDHVFDGPRSKWMGWSQKEISTRSEEVVGSAGQSLFKGFAYTVVEKARSLYETARDIYAALQMPDQVERCERKLSRLD